LVTYTPARHDALPISFHVYGSWLVQMLTLVVEVNTSLTVSTRVAMESHPVELVSVTSYVPAALNVSPFHVYGSWLVQMLILVVRSEEHTSELQSREKL